MRLLLHLSLPKPTTGTKGKEEGLGKIYFASLSGYVLDLHKIRLCIRSLKARLGVRLFNGSPTESYTWWVAIGSL